MTRRLYLGTFPTRLMAQGVIWGISHSEGKGCGWDNPEFVIEEIADLGRKLYEVYRLVE